MKYKVWNGSKQVIIPDELVSIFEKYRYQLNTEKIEYLLITEDVDINTSLDEQKLSNIIKKLMQEELQMIPEFNELCESLKITKEFI